MIEPSDDASAGAVAACHNPTIRPGAAFAAGRAAVHYTMAGMEAGSDDATIARAFADRTRAGIDAAYRAYGAALYSLAHHLLADVSDAQDCVHDALLRAWQRPNAYRPERGALRPFLMACVRDASLTRLRRNALDTRNEQHIAAAHGSDEFTVADPAGSGRLRNALAALPSEQHAALSLAYRERLTPVQIAQHLGVPLQTVKSRVALGLRKLAVREPHVEAAS